MFGEGFFLFSFFLSDMVSLCSLGWPSTHFEAEGGLELVMILLPQPSAGIRGMPHHALKDLFHHSQMKKKKKTQWIHDFYFK